MKERPILMTTESVKAILDGRKSMTRRTYGLEKINQEPDAHWYITSRDEIYWRFSDLRYEEEYVDVKCPYGQVGDRLWVRETWWYPPLDESQNKRMLAYKANLDVTTASQVRWRPSIFMPRWASRIDRIITLLRVEHLLDISEADARAEGFNSIEEFLVYWDILNKKRGYGTDINPWNWVIGW